MCNYIQYIFSLCNHAATPVFAYQLCADNCALRREEFQNYRYENHFQYEVSKEAEVEKVGIFSRCRLCQRDLGLIPNSYNDNSFMIIDGHHRRLTQHLTWIMPTTNVANPGLFHKVSYNRSPRRNLNTLTEQDEGEISPKTIPSRGTQIKAEPLGNGLSQSSTGFQLAQLDHSAKVNHLICLNAQLPKLHTNNTNRPLISSPITLDSDSARSSEKHRLPAVGELSAVDARGDLIPQPLRVPRSYERVRVVRVSPFAANQLSRSSISSQEADDFDFGFGGRPTRTAWEEMQSPSPVRVEIRPRRPQVIIPQFGRSLRHSEIANYTLLPGPPVRPITRPSLRPVPGSLFLVSPSPLVLPSPIFPLTKLTPLSAISPSPVVAPLKLTRHALPSPPKSLSKVNSKSSTNFSPVSPMSSIQPYSTFSPLALTPLSYTSPSLAVAPLVIKKKKPLPPSPPTPQSPETSSKPPSDETPPSSPRADSAWYPLPSPTKAQPSTTQAQAKSPDQPVRVPKSARPGTNRTTIHAARKAQGFVKRFASVIPSLALTPLSSTASPSLMPAPLFSTRSHSHAEEKKTDRPSGISRGEFVVAVGGYRFVLPPLEPDASPSLMPEPLFSRRPRGPRGFHNVTSSHPPNDRKISREREA